MDLLAALCTTALLLGQPLVVGRPSGLIAVLAGAVVAGLRVAAGSGRLAAGLLSGNAVALVTMAWLLPLVQGLRWLSAVAITALGGLFVLTALVSRAVGARDWRISAAADTLMVTAIGVYFLPFVPEFRVGPVALVVVAVAAMIAAALRWRLGAREPAPILLAATLPVIGPFSAVAAVNILSGDAGVALWAVSGVASVLLGLTAGVLMLVAVAGRR